MKQLIYGELTQWYRLFDQLDDHRDEGSFFATTFESVLGSGSAATRTLLELGAGAGNNAHFMKPHFRMVLTDLSPAMLELSVAINSECEHLPADMRTLRLDRQFDAVLIHDAIVYMTSERELEEALTTAFVHTRPGGAAIFAPDCTRETFREGVDDHAGDGTNGQRMRCFEWLRDPDPSDDQYVVDYAFFLEDNGVVRAVHDQHIEGLFSGETWIRLITKVGYQVTHIEREIDVEGPHPYVEHVFLAVRPE